MIGLKNMASKSQIKQEQMVAEIIKSLEAGLDNARGWQAPWNGAVTAPRNVVSGHDFTGGNAIWLWFANQMYGYPTNEWATVKQWNSIGAKIIKKEKAGLQYAIRPFFKKDEDGEEFINGFYAYSVFNIAQVENLPPEYVTKPKTELKFSNNSEINVFLGSCEIETRHSDEPRAYYKISKDYVHMPHKETFKSSNGYYSTIFHEYIHATGAEHRLAREGIVRPKSIDTAKSFFAENIYAKEELIAELGASFLCARYGIYNERREDTLLYLKSWISILKEKPSVLWSASSHAEEAVNYLLSKNEEVKIEQDLRSASVA